MNICIDFLMKCAPSLITAGMAFYIYSNWKNQKKSEVIAVESKKIIVLVAKLQVLQMEIYKKSRDGNLDLANLDEFKVFKDIKNELSDAIVFLGFVFDQKQELTDLSTNVLAQVINLINKINKQCNGLQLHDALIDNNDVYKLTKKLLDYALYKSKI